MKQISVVVADSSPFVCRLLKTYLESVPDIRVIGAANKGQQFVEMIASQHPDVATLGLEMPDMTGLDALQSLQRTCPTPAVIISGANMHAAAMTLEALHYGAVDFVCKFTPGTNVAPESLRQEIINKVRLAAGANAAGPTMPADAYDIKPGTNAKLKKLLSGLGAVSLPTLDITSTKEVAAATEPLPPEQIVVIGASTGGPVALQQLLSQLPADFSGSVLVIQHLPPTFTAVLAEQMARQLNLRVKEAESGDCLQRGAVLIAPGGMNIRLDEAGTLQCVSASSYEDNVPSINLAMESAAAVYSTQVRGILLTGMGEDGVAGLAAIRQQGGITYAQSLDTCTVKGMPQRAMEAEVVDYTAPPQQIARLLLAGY